MLQNLLHDVRYALHGFASRPMFAVVVVLTLAVGIGVNVAVFSIYEQIMLRELNVSRGNLAASLLFGLAPTDPWAVTSAVAVLAGCVFRRELLAGTAGIARRPRRRVASRVTGRAHGASIERLGEGGEFVERL